MAVIHLAGGTTLELKGTTVLEVMNALATAAGQAANFAVFPGKADDDEFVHVNPALVTHVVPDKKPGKMYVG